ncbi:unnamed protein product [Phaedon cochleariae]|uniref:HTH psq-type domain-containing protein n=1 Tax=Phaedon cochleariae TaxID=80249 RepID=A0A9P0DJS4_PHACE|nr:unnamed protein product [Phaedon cochleariae]
MSAKTNKRPLRSLTAHEKLDAIRRVHDGESKASVARDIGVPESTLRGWCKNEDKISYLSRQSSPETDESLDHSQSKKPKHEEPTVQPFNLSLKSSGGSYSPNSAVDYTKNLKNEADCKPPTIPTNLSKVETPKSTTAHSSAHSTTLMSERERNRAELARLSVELGLNRQEMFMPNVNNTSANLADLSANIGLLAQWNTLLMQQQHQQQQKVLQTSKVNKVTAPADTSGMVSSSVGLLTTVDQEKAKQLQLPKEKQSVHESVWYWLKTQQQSMINMSQTPTTVPNTTSAMNGNGISSSMSPPTTTTVTNSTTPNLNGLNGMTADQSSWFWKWYKQFAYSQQGQQLQQPLPQVHQLQPQVQQPHSQVHQPHSQVQQPQLLVPVQDDRPILYQQLTKDMPQLASTPPPLSPPDQQNAENLSMHDDRNKMGDKTNNKARSVLDNLLFNNNNNVALNKKDENLEEDNLSQSEAVEHGEKFLKWLESCSDPSVTAMQIMQFRTLLNNVKTGADRKNGDIQNKAKVKRK